MTTPFTVELSVDLNEFPAKEEALGRSGAAGLSPSTSVLPAVLGGRRVRGRVPRFGGE